MTKLPLIPLAAAVLLTFLVTGCETDDGGITARTQEKSAAYAKLQFWQKSFIAKGVIAEGFTPDMVYMAMGKPNKIDTKQLSQGSVELWTYSQYYPNVDAVHGFEFASYNSDSAYQPLMPKYQKQTSSGLERPEIPWGMDRGQTQSIGVTGGPQGGSMEPAGLRSYTVLVLFQDGHVARIGVAQNFQ